MSFSPVNGFRVELLVNSNFFLFYFVFLLLLSSTSSSNLQAAGKRLNFLKTNWSTLRNTTYEVFLNSNIMHGIPSLY